MNDFTKDELEYLMQKFMLTKGDDFEHNLEKKLQFMIDNYCPHIDSNISFCCEYCGHIA